MWHEGASSISTMFGNTLDKCGAVNLYTRLLSSAIAGAVNNEINCMCLYFPHKFMSSLKPCALMSLICTLCPRCLTTAPKQTPRRRADPPGVCADMTPPTKANHKICYISPRCNIQTPRQRCPALLFWHLNKTEAT